MAEQKSQKGEYSFIMPCPKGVGIPGRFTSNSTMYTESDMSGRAPYSRTVALASQPCPALISWPMKAVSRLGRKFLLHKK